MAKRFWNGRPVFVSGATGLMGGWLVKQLLAEGADVVALVRDSVPRTIFVTEGLAARVTTVQGCLEDAPCCEERYLSTPSGRSSTWRRSHWWEWPKPIRSALCRPSNGNLECARVGPPRRSIGNGDGILRQSLRHKPGLAVSGDPSAAGNFSLRRLQELRGPYFHHVRRNLRVAGSHPALRQSLRRRRSEFQPHYSRRHPIYA